jgi:hypothetical protein
MKWYDSLPLCFGSCTFFVLPPVAMCVTSRSINLTSPACNYVHLRDFELLNFSSHVVATGLNPAVYFTAYKTG